MRNLKRLLSLKNFVAAWLPRLCFLRLQRPASPSLLEGMVAVEDMAVSGVTPESGVILASLVIRATHAFSETLAALS